MLTRLKVDGFKNLDGVDVRFGAFTCVVGANGVGKSNLFDAIVTAVATGGVRRCPLPAFQRLEADTRSALQTLGLPLRG
jgi:recombinational DNA repair ATPase RecF